MSTFVVNIVSISSIEPHPDADAIEIAMIGRYRSIVRKTEGLKAGMHVVYIPEASVIPEYLLKRMGLWDHELGKGLLGGEGFNRVSPKRLRGVFSQGICMPVLNDPDNAEIVWVDGENGRFPARVGEDLAALLGITKWEPTIPPELLGDVFAPGQHLTAKFDVEDIKAHPDIFAPGEEVEMREKLHGVFTAVGILPKSDGIEGGFGLGNNILLYSKGLGAQGMAFADTVDNASSIYVRSTVGIRARIDELEFNLSEPLTVMGETFGPGVQDLHYGNRLQYRIFAACRGYRGDQRYLDADALAELAARLHVEVVPVLYRGPFSWDMLAEHTTGPSSMDSKHIREGVVVTPVIEREDMRLGRVALKSVSEKYLLRKGGTEYS